MYYAIVGGVRTKPEKGLSGLCPQCRTEVISKCGEVMAHHWAHKTLRECDTWAEGETQWHIDWKSRFEPKFLEVTIRKGDKVHRADVKFDHGLVLEIQNSPIKVNEIKKRNYFYQNIAWIINGQRLSRDLDIMNDLIKSKESIREPISISSKNLGFKKTWSQIEKPVLIDFGDFTGIKESYIFLYLSVGDEEYLYPIIKNNFIESCKESGRLEGELSLIIRIIKDQKKLKHLQKKLIDYLILIKKQRVIQEYKIQKQVESSTPCEDPELRREYLDVENARSCKRYEDTCNAKIISSVGFKFFQAGWMCPLIFPMAPIEGNCLQKYLSNLKIGGTFSFNNVSNFTLTEICDSGVNNSNFSAAKDYFEIWVRNNALKSNYKVRVFRGDTKFIHDFY